jgi:hypothetical protein
MPDPIRILESLGLSGLVAGVVLLAFGRPWRSPHPVRARIGGVLGVGGGILAGVWWLGMPPNWPPREDHDRLLLVLVPAVMAVEVLIAVFAKPRWLLRLAIAASAAPILLYGSSYVSDPTGPGSREWTPVKSSLILAGLAALLAVVWCALWLLTKRSACRTVPIVLALVCAGGSVTVLLSGYAGAGQAGLTIAAALVGAVVASLVLKGTPELNGVVSVGIVGLFALLLVGRFFGQLTTTNALLLFCAPLLTWGAEVPLVRRGGRIAHGMVRVILPTIPVAVALLLAQRQFIADTSKTATESDQEPTVDDYMNFGK